MNHFNAHQHLLSTQCGGLSSCWARAARDEAREAAHGESESETDAAGPADRGARTGRLGAVAGVAGLAFAAGAVGMLAVWISALPLDAKASHAHQAQAVPVVRAPA